MKKVIKIFLIALVIFYGNETFSQDTMYVVQGGIVTVAVSTNQIDSITFYRPGAISTQDRLNSGETPLAIYNSDTTLLDSLYGKMYRGGFIAYLNPLDGTGFVAAPSDIRADIQGLQWGCHGVQLAGASGKSIGSGAQNTVDIESGCSTPNSAAEDCANYSVNGYSDWSLPSEDELKTLWTNLAVNNLGDFKEVLYWSSTQYDKDFAYAHFFKVGENQSAFAKAFRWYVRAIRYY